MWSRSRSLRITVSATMSRPWLTRRRGRWLPKRSVRLAVLHTRRFGSSLCMQAVSYRCVLSLSTFCSRAATGAMMGARAAATTAAVSGAAAVVAAVAGWDRLCCTAPAIVRVGETRGAGAGVAEAAGCSPKLVLVAVREAAPRWRGQSLTVRSINEQAKHVERWLNRPGAVGVEQDKQCCKGTRSKTWPCRLSVASQQGHVHNIGPGRQTQESNPR